MRKSIITMSIMLLLTGLGVSACNTMSGAGKDVQAAGQGMENSAERNKR